MAIRFEGPLLRGRWRMGPRLGVGGQGHTFLARDEQAKAERVVVVKRYRLGDGGWKKHELFEREARVLAQLDHPAIPKVLDRFDGDDEGTFYLVMAKAPGATLRLIATKVRFTDAELRDLLLRTLDILAYLHDRRPPVIHRDIKPANLLRDADGRISLVDFGGVRDALHEGATSTVVGTFGYMAPEQLHGQATPRTDLFGLAATIVALGTGVEPEHIPRRGLRMDLARVLPTMDPGLRGLLERMTDPDPDHRPATARDAKDLLKMRLPAPRREPREPGGAPLDEDARLPRPLRWLMRALLVVVGTAGWLSMTVAESVITPLIFAIIRIFTGKERDKKIKGVEATVRGALREGSHGFRALQRRALRPPRRIPLPSKTDPRQLPPRRR